MLDHLGHLLLLPVAVASSAHLLVFSPTLVLELLLLVDRLGLEMDLLQLEHVEDIEDRVCTLVHIHGQSPFDLLHIGVQFLLHFLSGQFDYIDLIPLSLCISFIIFLIIIRPIKIVERLQCFPFVL